MQTQKILNVYSFILNEDEWYSTTEQQKEAWINQILREGGESGCRYLVILVEPDAVMSISPDPKRHRVWGHTFETTAEQNLHSELIAICARYVGHGANKLSIQQAATVARGVFER